MNWKDQLGQIIKNQRELVIQLQDLAQDPSAGQWSWTGPVTYPKHTYSKGKFGPKSANHPSVDEPCPACKLGFMEGDYTTLVLLGPGSDDEAQERARHGRAYDAVAVEVHWACATGEVT